MENSSQPEGFIILAFTAYNFIIFFLLTYCAKLRKLKKNLKQANALLLEKDRIKSEYVLRVTHDIKEHLAAIQSCIEPVTAKIVGTLNEKQADLLQRADKRTGKLLFFVKALLDITRIRLSKELNFEYLSFADVLSDAIANLALKAKDKSIGITHAIEPGVNKIRGDREYLQEIIVGMLANAVKYTPRNGKIEINVADEGNSIHIRIKDTGIGIPKEEIDKVFDEFYRAKNAREVEKDGTGLGLSIARQVIERHKGKIWVESEEGKGSAFHIILPK